MVVALYSMEGTALENFVMCLHDEMCGLVRRVDDLERENRRLQDVADAATAFEVVNYSGPLQAKIYSFYLEFETEDGFALRPFVEDLFANLPG